MIIQVIPVIDRSVRDLCRRAYEGHPKGCPNHGQRAFCPPRAPLFADVFDVAKPFWAVVNEFDLAAHRARLQAKHPDWSRRRLDCCLYWQAGARKALHAQVQDWMVRRDDIDGLRAVFCPEAMGVNVTATLKAAGIELEWPPVNIARQVALVGGKRVPA